MNYIWQTQMWLLQGGSVFLLKTMTYQTAHVVYLHFVRRQQKVSIEKKTINLSGEVYNFTFMPKFWNE